MALHLHAVMLRLAFSLRYLDYKYLIPLVRLNPELNARQYGLTQKHIDTAPNLYARVNVHGVDYSLFQLSLFSYNLFVTAFN